MIREVRKWILDMDGHCIVEAYHVGQEVRLTFDNYTFDMSVDDAKEFSRLLALVASQVVPNDS